MKYEFLIQPQQPGTAYDPAPLDALLEARGAPKRPDGVRTLRLKGGDIELGPYREAGAVVATEVKVPMSDRADLVREAFVETLGMASALGLKVVDPQLARSVILNDESVVAVTYLRAADYAGRYSGDSGAVSAAAGAQSYGLPPGSKLFLILAVLALALFLLLNP